MHTRIELWRLYVDYRYGNVSVFEGAQPLTFKRWLEAYYPQDARRFDAQDKARAGKVTNAL
jgi:hypothetical protein